MTVFISEHEAHFFVSFIEVTTMALHPECNISCKHQGSKMERVPLSWRVYYKLLAVRFSVDPL